MTAALASGTRNPGLRSSRKPPDIPCQSRRSVCGSLGEIWGRCLRRQTRSKQIQGLRARKELESGRSSVPNVGSRSAAMPTSCLFGAVQNLHLQGGGVKPESAECSMHSDVSPSCFANGLGEFRFARELGATMYVASRMYLGLIPELQVSCRSLEMPRAGILRCCLRGFYKVQDVPWSSGW